MFLLKKKRKGKGEERWGGEGRRGTEFLFVFFCSTGV
jgi:hypothetical protein